MTNGDHHESDGQGGGQALRAARPCPICGKPSAPERYPFCSKRCADVDLNRWLSGSYVIPGREDETEEDETEED